MKHSVICTLLSFSLCVSMIPSMKAYASDPYAGHESEWLARCSTAQENAQAAQECSDFKEYYEQKSLALKDKINDMEQEAVALNEDMSNIRDVIAQLDDEISTLNKQIESAEQAIVTMQETIVDLDQKMQEKQEEIKRYDAFVKARMQSEQVGIGINRYIDVIMGAKDIVDLIRLVDGLNKITESDQRQIEAAAQAKAEYQLQQQEQVRLQETIEQQQQVNKELKQVADESKQKQEMALNEFRKQQLALMEQIQNTRGDFSSIQGSIADINTSIRDDIFEPSQPEEPENPEDEGGEQTTPPSSGNSSWIKPISYPWYCGTWYYPDGVSPHLGADYSGPSGAAVVAPANSIVLFANAPYQNSQHGWIGWPAGAGNSIHLLTQVNGVTYGISFFHLSPGLLVKPGDLVSQGQVIAYSGDSGNSTGPHLHVEVINLGSLSITQAQKQFSQSADFAWGSGWGLSSTCDVRSAPCRIRPESVFGY